MTPSLSKSQSRWMVRIGGMALLALVVSPVLAPPLLAFPHQQEIGAHQVYSVVPISHQIIAKVEEADRKVAAAPIGLARKPDQPIYLTDGGWRWKWLAGSAQGAFAINRAVNEGLIINRLAPEGDRIINGALVGGERDLGQVIAHEMAHGSIRAYFGWTSDIRYSQELLEGYCDHVAGGGSLSDAEAQALIDGDESHPALPYWLGRKRIERELAKPGASVDQLFAQWQDE